MPEYKVSESDVGKRVDEILFSTGEFLSRSKAQALIKEGEVLLNEKPCKAGNKVDLGDIITYSLPKQVPTDLIGENIPLDVIYEDDYLIVVNKPAGLVVHPGNGHPTGTLANALVYRNQDIDASDTSRPGIVHRIDKDTSGLICIAKKEEAMLGLVEQLKDHSMHREYVALVSGIIKEEEGKIDAPLGRDKKDRIKFCVDLEGKEAVTFFKVKQRFLRSKVTFIECRLLTGRTHQIRAHMEYIGHPVVGDPLYGKGNRTLYDKGQLLHAYRLSFIHPITKEEMSFTAPLPDHFLEVLSKLS
ncbi:MAG: RluA family pseudouridine synthase [Bacilli bacterium]|nr:RluA family pseudouridine synthase [Bacilli bacterium]MBQ4255100.1 RluA family pseudouridine synthase [Bacilli bacterium]